ncbi:hypothetical protein [Pacificibacter maritimus]|nr:hypothetical protein [Pacificibacter maritimus]
MSNSPVDELAQIKNSIAELRAREHALETRFVQLRNSGPFSGFAGELVIEQTAHEVFDIAKLPDTVLNDPRFYSLRQVTSVRIEPHEETNSHALFAQVTRELPCPASPHS